MDLYLGIDLGTTYCKAGLFDANGQLRGLGRVPVIKYSPFDKACELPVTVLWSTLQEAILQAFKEADAEPKQVKAVSYAAQANSFVLLNKQYEPLTPMLLWPDERAGKLHPQLQDFCAQTEWNRITGMGISLSSQSCINKLKWYSEQPVIWNQVSAVLTLSDYLTFVLTGELMGDTGTASLLGLRNIQAGTWWQEALAMIPVKENQLTTLYRTGHEVGKLTARGAALTGLHTGVLFFLGGLDHHIAAIGAGIHQHPFISESTGTVLAAVQYTNGYQPAPGVCTAPGLQPPYFFNLTFDEPGTGLLDWYQQTKAAEYALVQLLQMAAAVPAGCEGLTATAIIDNNKTIAVFHNANTAHHHGYFVRAILEAITYRLQTILNRLDNNGQTSVISTGGGARSHLWVQIKADITGRTFHIPVCNEAACLGAALLAATGTGLFSNATEAAAHWVQYKVITALP